MAAPVAPGVAPFETDWVKDGEDVGVVDIVCVIVKEDVRLPVEVRVDVFVLLAVIDALRVWVTVWLGV